MEYKTMRNLLKAKKTLQNALSQILEINRKKFSPTYSTAKPEVREAIQTELKLWNKIAEHKAKMIKMYEQRLQEVG